MYGKYKATWKPEHPKEKDGYVHIHILVAEEKLGRKLKKNETVHHLDNNKLNNNPDNIIVFATNSDHAQFHRTGIMIQKGDVFISEAKPKTHKCKQCGILCYRDFCSRKCVSLYERKVQRPNREELKYLIKNHTMLFVGKFFGVSDNAIRKWCKQYNLPSASKEIKNYSNEQWESI